MKEHVAKEEQQEVRTHDKIYNITNNFNNLLHFLTKRGTPSTPEILTTIVIMTQPP